MDVQAIMAQFKKNKTPPLKPAEWLDGIDWEWSKYSQSYEDGLIDACLDHYGVHNEWCFEVGAGDGKSISNTLRLRELGWHALLVEKSPKEYAELVKHQSMEVHTFLTEADAGSLETMLRSVDAPIDLDLGVIDIDGNDYWMWHDMHAFRPRLMLIEFGYFTDPDFLPKPGEGCVGFQAGFNQILALGEMKKYVPVANTMCNLLFARWDLDG